MDGVIIDSEPQHAKAGVLALKKYGVDITTDYCYGFIGTTTYAMCQHMIEEFHLSISAEELLNENTKMKQYLAETEGYIPVPFVISMIKDFYANGLKLIVASSSPEAEIRATLDALHISSYFMGYVSGMSVTHPKPAPDVFLAALDRLSFSASECIVIEDSMNGALAAKAADIPCIGLINPNSGKQDLSSACMLVESFEEVDTTFITNVYKRVHQIP